MLPSDEALLDVSLAAAQAPAGDIVLVAIQLAGGCRSARAWPEPGRSE
jgi:subtilase family serine protease